MPTNKPETTPGGENLLAALISCTTAAAFSATCTYPFDFIKTQQQLNNEKVITPIRLHNYIKVGVH